MPAHTPSKTDAVRLAAVLKWRAADEELGRAARDELELRLAAIQLAFPEGLGRGTTNLVLHDGSTLKAEVGAKAKVDKELIDAALGKLRKLGADGVLLAERLVKWTPEGSLSEFEKLTPAQRKLLGSAITIVLSKTPSLKLKPAD